MNFSLDSHQEAHPGAIRDTLTADPSNWPMGTPSTCMLFRLPLLYCRLVVVTPESRKLASMQKKQIGRAHV